MDKLTCIVIENNRCRVKATMEKPDLYHGTYMSWRLYNSHIASLPIYQLHESWKGLSVGDEIVGVVETFYVLGGPSVDYFLPLPAEKVEEPSDELNQAAMWHDVATEIADNHNWLGQLKKRYKLSPSASRSFSRDEMEGCLNWLLNDAHVTGGSDDMWWDALNHKWYTTTQLIDQYLQTLK